MSNENGHLTRERLLEMVRATKKIQLVNLPSGVAVYVHALKGNERDELEDAFSIRGKSNVGMRGLFAALSLCDEHGTRLFESTDAELVSATFDGADLEVIVDASRRLSRIGADVQDEVQKN